MSVRLIDANKIFPWYLKAFSAEEAGEERAIGPDEVRFSMNDIRENLDNIPTECKWIPCNERQPEEDGEYLVTLCWSNYPNSVETLHFTNDLSSVDRVGYAGEKRPGWYEYDSDYGCYEIDNVIAWMPHPEPYEED
jgi:hypothetical protein